MAKNHVAFAAVTAIALVALVGVLGIVSVAGIGAGSAITGGATVTGNFVGLASDNVLAAVVVLLGVGLGYMYLRKNKYL